MRQAAKELRRSDPAAGIAAFVHAVAEAKPGAERLLVPHWRAADWEALFAFARPQQVLRSAVLIEQDGSDRALYFLVSGRLQVVAVLGSDAPGVIATVDAGSVVGELAFFDGRPRLAKVWAVEDSALYRLEFEDYRRFADAHPRQACELVFALGVIVASRLRRTQSRAGR